MVCTSRRQFLKTLTLSGALCFPYRTVVKAQSPQVVQFHKQIEPLGRVLEVTPRERLLEEIGLRVRQGLDDCQLLAAPSWQGCAIFNRGRSVLNFMRIESSIPPTWPVQIMRWSHVYKQRFGVDF